MKRVEQFSELPVLTNFINMTLVVAVRRLGVLLLVSLLQNSRKQDGSCVENLVAKTGPAKNQQW
jgi:hypothetical protein